MTSNIPPESSRAEQRRNLPPSEIPCKFYQQGYCARASKCWFKHDAEVANRYLSDQIRDLADQEANPVEAEGSKMRVFMTAAVREKAKLEHSQNNAISVLESHEPVALAESEHNCSICYEKPSTFGLLEHCNHVFCLECIRQWRASTSNDCVHNNDEFSRTSKTCPLCRKTSTFIIPSSIFPSDTFTNGSTEYNPKRVIIDNYLSRMKLIPCKYFQDSLNGASAHSHRPRKPRCRFGNSCHYAHVDPETGETYTFTDREVRSMRRSAAHGLRTGRFSNDDVIASIFGDLEDDDDYNPAAMHHVPIQWYDSEQLPDNLWLYLEDSVYSPSIEITDFQHESDDEAYGHWADVE